MESNDDQSLKLISDPTLDIFANKCIDYLKTQKIEESRFHLFINDEILKRFFVARDQNLEKALVMWQNWTDWRIKYKPEEIDETMISNELKSGKAFLHGFDKEGRPCVVLKHCKHIPKQTDFDEFMRFAIYLQEKLCKLADETGTRQVSVIVDRDGATWENFDKRFLGSTNLAGMLQDYYAERLYKIYVVKTNFLFKILFNIVKPFIAEKTKGKIVIIDSLDELKNYFTEENLLKEHGGTSNFEYTYP